MAYLRKLDERCHFETCGKRAVVELLSRRNSSMGKYCRICGRRRLIEEQAAEIRKPGQGASW